jgi:monoterpene epsilon-lactone hydrolase
MASSQSISYIQILRQNPAFGALGFDLTELRQGMSTRRESDLPGVRYLSALAGGIPAEWVLAPGADPDLRLLYLHGGGYISGYGAFYLAMAAHISAAADCAVLLPDYRLGPEHPFPAGLEDCLSAYQWLLETGPQGPALARAVFIGGDSAGGGLSLASLLALRDRRLSLPRGAFALSPFADLSLTAESIRSQAKLDPIMHPNCLPEFVTRYVQPNEVRSPLVSPAFGDYTGLPSLLIHVGEHEIIRDDSIQVADRARAAGVTCDLEIWPGMFHVFQSHEPLLPEGRQSIDQIAAFLRS